jgi:hypothetical protein
MLGEEIEIRFRMVSDEGTQLRGFKADDFFIEDLFDVTTPADPIPVFENFTDPMDTMDNWCGYVMQYGNWWNWTGGYEWCNYFPALPIDNAIVWATEISDAYYAQLEFSACWEFYGDMHGYCEISADGGANWFVLEHWYEDSLIGPTGCDDFEFDLTFWAGNTVLIRFRVQGEEDDVVLDGGLEPGFICIENPRIWCKVDLEAPISTHTLSGTMSDAGWYITPVTVKITAIDEGAGMGEIHYILDGSESVVAGNTAQFTVSSNGAHNIEYWAVDKTGNEEAHHIIPTFQIDAGSPPSVSITGPEPGLYLFGNKLLSLSKVFIIGAFTAEATASDAESGVYRVQFLLDGDLVAEDTEAPYSAYIAEKHMGAGTLKVVAEDFSGNSAEDTLDITYYKFL